MAESGALRLHSGAPFWLLESGLEEIASPLNAEADVAIIGAGVTGALVADALTAEGKSVLQKLSSEFKSNPSSMMWHDANQDGEPDLVVLIPYEKIKILLRHPGQDFEEVDVPAPGGALEQPWMTASDVDGDGKAELLLPQKNFLRAVVLKVEDAAADPRTWSFVVKDQINGTANNSRLVGATAVRNGGSAVSSLFLFDAETYGGMARLLGEGFSMGDHKRATTYMDSVREVTAVQVNEFARKYLAKEHRTSIELKPR